jgi:uncharacterized protein YndB with AHSA1/START domain
MSEPKFVYVTYIATTPEKLWQALTDGAFTRQYWFGTSVKSDWSRGSRVIFRSGGDVHDTGEVLDCVPISPPVLQLAGRVPRGLPPREAVAGDIRA